MFYRTILKRTSGKGFGVFKPLLADLIISIISPIREEYEKLKVEIEYLTGTLNDGSIQAKYYSDPLMETIKDRMGML